MSNTLSKSINILQTPVKGGRHLLCIYRLDNLTAYEKHLLVYLGGRSSFNGLDKYGKFSDDTYVKISISDLAIELSLGETTIKATIKNLVEKGYINKTNNESKIGRTYSNYYHVTDKIFKEYEAKYLINSNKENIIIPSNNNIKYEIDSNISDTKESTNYEVYDNHLEPNIEPIKQIISEEPKKVKKQLSRRAKDRRLNEITSVIFGMSEYYDTSNIKRKLDLPFSAKVSLLSGMEAIYGLDKVEQFYDCVIKCQLINYVQPDGEWLIRVFNDLPKFIYDKTNEYNELIARALEEQKVSYNL
jgi:DNA-binding MarR family transcriptional regulator